MSKYFSDQEISDLLQEPKPLASDWRQKTILRPKRGHKEKDLDFEGSSGSNFKLILRQNNVNVMDFSIILAVYVPGTNKLFRLKRYNGKSHEHTNHIEGDTFYDFHIHMATERYQEIGTREDSYAEPTDRYSDYRSAWTHFVQDERIEIPPEPQGDLFEDM